MIRLVLFDIDGTLIRSGGAGVRAFAETAARTFDRPGAIQGMDFAGRTDTALVREFFGRQGIGATDENFRRFFADYLGWLEHFLRELDGAVLPGVVAGLAALRGMAAPPLAGLLTGNIRRGAELKLGRYGLWSDFALGAFADDHEDRNQIAALARARGEEALKRTLEGGEILVIGDTPHDIACARAIGARVLAVATGRHNLAELTGLGPDHAAASLGQVDLAALCGTR